VRFFVGFFIVSPLEIFLLKPLHGRTIFLSICCCLLNCHPNLNGTFYIINKTSQKKIIIPKTVTRQAENKTFLKGGG